MLIALVLAIHDDSSGINIYGDALAIGLVYVFTLHDQVIE